VDDIDDKSQSFTVLPHHIVTLTESFYPEQVFEIKKRL